MVFSSFRQKSLSFCLFFAVGCILNVSTVFAAPPEQTETAPDPKVGPGCDPSFMKAMQDKAWMEAQREIMIAQSTIAKPDSVFSLGCFKTWADGLKIEFSEGNQYDYAGKIGSYISSAFGHSHGGGHYSSGENTTISDCKAMANLWNAARSANVDSPSKLLGTLKDISQYDRGTFPKTAPLPTGFTNPLKKFYDPKVVGASVGTLFDDMSLFSLVTDPLSQLRPPPNSSTPPDCAKGIPTGIFISVSGGDRPEIVCPNPGCISDGKERPKCCAYDGTTKCSLETTLAAPCVSGGTVNGQPIPCGTYVDNTGQAAP
jgi:hypothetical protein